MNLLEEFRTQLTKDLCRNAIDSDLWHNLIKISRLIEFNAPISVLFKEMELAVKNKKIETINGEWKIINKIGLKKVMKK